MMRFDVLVNVVREGFVWWFKNDFELQGRDFDLWEKVWVAIEEHSIGWLDAVRTADANS